MLPSLPSAAFSPRNHNERQAMTDPKAIAARLSETQRSALGFLSVKPWEFSLRWAALVGYSLERMGLAKRTFWRDKFYITPLGLAVRKALQEQS